jgi:LL-diaminopimelate aminotransferase
MKNPFSKRIAQSQEYYFSQKLREVSQLIREGKPVIHLGIGSPDLPPHPSVIEAMQLTVTQDHIHGYQGYQGIPELRMAFADFYQKHYGVTLNPQEEILPLMGSKEGIFHIAMAFLDPGDQVLIPDPGYPTYRSVCQLLDVEAKTYELKKENHWYPDFDVLEQMDLSLIKMMWVNYPHMPTGARASIELFERLVSFAKKHQILLVHDNPYSFILENSPKSIMAVDGAKEVAIELNSLSKTSNLAGWRVGVVVGQPAWIKAIIQVKSNLDSGMFYGIQKGAIAALGLDKTWYEKLNDIYQRRRELIWELAEKLEMTYDRYAVGMFVWAKVKEGRDATAICDELLYEKSLFVTPGVVFGEQGKGYIRFSLCCAEEKIKEALGRFES